MLIQALEWVAWGFCMGAGWLCANWVLSKVLK
jgi:hypothetical protein